MPPTIKVEKYSEKSFVVRGNTKEIKEQLKELNGKFNPNLQGGAGWIYPMKSLTKIKTALSEIRGLGYIVWEGIDPQMTQEDEEKYRDFLLYQIDERDERIEKRDEEIYELQKKIKELENELDKELKRRIVAETDVEVLKERISKILICMDEAEEAEEAEAEKGKPNPKTNIIRCGVCFEEGLECNIGPADNPICGECERELHPERFQSEAEGDDTSDEEDYVGMCDEENCSERATQGIAYPGHSMVFCDVHYAINWTDHPDNPDNPDNQEGDDTSDEEDEGDDYCECCWCSKELTKTKGFMVGDEMVCEECFKKPKAEAEPKTKTCKSCKKDKPLEKFAKKTSPTLFLNCSDCRAK